MSPEDPEPWTGWQKNVTGDYLFHGRDGTSLPPGRVLLEPEQKEAVSQRTERALNIYVG